MFCCVDTLSSRVWLSLARSASLNLSSSHPKPPIHSSGFELFTRSRTILSISSTLFAFLRSSRLNCLENSIKLASASINPGTTVLPFRSITFAFLYFSVSSLDLPEASILPSWTAIASTIVLFLSRV